MDTAPAPSGGLGTRVDQALRSARGNKLAPNHGTPAPIHGAKCMALNPQRQQAGLPHPVNLPRKPLTRPSHPQTRGPPPQGTFRCWQSCSTKREEAAAGSAELSSGQGAGRAARAAAAAAGWRGGREARWRPSRRVASPPQLLGAEVQVEVLQGHGRKGEEGMGHGRCPPQLPVDRRLQHPSALTSQAGPSAESSSMRNAPSSSAHSQLVMVAV